MAENIPQEKGLMAKLADSQAAPPWGIGEVGLALLVLMIGLLIIGTSFTASVASNSNNPESITYILGWMLGLVIVAIFVFIRWRRTKERFDALQLANGKWHPLLAILVGIAGTFTAASIAGLGSAELIAPMQVIGVNNVLTSLVSITLFVIVVQPIAEGLVFWGIALPRLRASWGAWAGLLTSVLLFAIYYYLVFGSRTSGGLALWYGAVYPLIIGFTLAAVRVWSQSTRSAILAQMGVGISILLTLIVT